jgi:hypothetical protein
MKFIPIDHNPFEEPPAAVETQDELEFVDAIVEELATILDTSLPVRRKRLRDGLLKLVVKHDRELMNARKQDADNRHVTTHH